MAERASFIQPDTPGARLGLIWGFDFGEGEPTQVDAGHGEPALARGKDDFRWLHLNLADQSTRRWFEGATLPPAIRELLLSSDRHQRVLIEDGMVACIIHDSERDFDPTARSRMGSLTVLLQPGLIVTARVHPLCAADIVRDRIRAGARPRTAAAALDLLLGAIAEVAGRAAVELLATVQAAEDALLDDGRDPDTRALVMVRKRAIQLDRQLTGIRHILHRLEGEEDLPDDLEPTVAKLAQRMSSLHGDVAVIQSNLRLLREELEIQTANRTGQNLYLLSILSALLLPATLVTGIFGMNTGGLPGTASAHGTLLAVLLLIASSGGVYVWLRRMGFFQR